MKYVWHTDFINCGWRRYARLDFRTKVRKKAVICKPRSAIIDHCNFIFPITLSKSAYSHIARALREKTRAWLSTYRPWVFFPSQICGDTSEEKAPKCGTLLKKWGTKY